MVFVPTVFACSGGIARLGNLEPEAAAWMRRIKGLSANYTSKSVVCNDYMVKALKANGLRSSIVRMNTYTGVNVAAVQAALISDANPTVNDSPQQLDEADFSEATGLTGNGTNEFMLSGCTQGDLYALDSVNHSFTYGAYVCASNNQSGFAMGEFNGSDYCYLYVSNAGATSFFSTGISANQISVGDSAGSGLYVGSYNSTTDAKLYKRGAQIGTTATPGATHNNGYFVGLLDVNNQNTLNPVAPSTKTWGGYFCGRGIDATGQLVLNYIWERGMTILGRAAA